MRRLLVFISIFTLVAFAAEIAGTWKGTAEGPSFWITVNFQGTDMRVNLQR